MYNGIMDFLEKIGLSEELFVSSFWSFVPNLAAAALTAVLMVVFYSLTARVIKAGLLRTAMQPSLVEITVHSLYKWTVVIFGIILVLSQLGVDVTAAIAGVGVAGIAIGFAAKETLANVMSGFGIFIDHLYKRGDWVEIAGKYGQVKEITLRTTKIRTLDNIFIILPNAEVTMNPVVNYSEEGMVRITVPVGIAYKESIDDARRVIIEAVGTIDGVRAQPEPQVVVDELGDSSVNLLVRIWVDDPGSDKYFRFALTEATKKALDTAGIEIPFPQRVVYQK
jgi:small conductance mechanosensitive channel